MMRFFHRVEEGQLYISLRVINSLPSQYRDAGTFTQRHMLFLGDFMIRSVLDMMLLASRAVQKLTRLRTQSSDWLSSMNCT